MQSLSPQSLGPSQSLSCPSLHDISGISHRVVPHPHGPASAQLGSGVAVHPREPRPGEPAIEQLPPEQ
jgi:hypothetical protein